LGVVVGLLVTRPWQHDAQLEASVTEPVPSAPAGAAAPPSASVEPSKPVTASAPPARTFRLPTMNVASLPETRAKTTKPAEVAPLRLPKDWLVRGTAPDKYLITSDKAHAMSGQSSVLIAAHDRNVAATTFASLLQSVVAEPWLGKRVVFTVNIEPGEWFGDDVAVWIRALDASNVVISYNEWEAAYVKKDWQKQSVAIDVPWSATEIAYGVNVHGSSKMWIDGAQFDAVDKNVEVGARNIPSRLGVTAQDASERGPLALPSNLDFEIIVDGNGNPLEAPKDQLGRKKF
jgi:hypothetical protein